MNWFFTILILKTLAITWPAPIDIEDTRNDLSRFIDNDVGRTKASVLNESFTEAPQNLHYEIKNFTAKVQQKFEEEIKANVLEESKESLKSKVDTANTTKNPTVGLNLNVENATNISEESSQKTSATTPQQVHFKALTGTNSEFESETSTQIFLNDTNQSKQEEFVTESYHEFQTEAQELIETVTNQAIEQHTQASLEVLTKTSTENDIINSNNSDEVSKESLATDVHTTNSILNENSSDSIKFSTQTTTESDNNSRAHTREEVTVEIFPSTLIFEHSTLDSQEESTESATEYDSSSTNVPQTITKGSLKDSSINILNNNSQKFEKGNLNLKQSIDTFGTQLDLVNQDEESLSTSSTEQSTETIGESTEFSPNYPHISNDNFFKAVETTETQTKHNPSFKDAVDSFIADVMEIGSHLGLINQTEKREHIQTTKEILRVNVQKPSTSLPEANSAVINQEFVTSFPQLNTSVESLLHLQDSLEDRTTIKQDISLTNPENVFNSSARPSSDSAKEQKSKESNLINSVENLVGSASEFATEIGETFKNIFPNNENVKGRTQEDGTEQSVFTSERHSSTQHYNYPSLPATENTKEFHFETFTTTVPYEIRDENTFEINRQVEKGSTHTESISATQTSMEASENSPEVGAVSIRPIEIEKTFSNQESTSAGQALLEVEYTTNNPAFSATSQSSFEIYYTFSNPEATSAGPGVQDVENNTHTPELNNVKENISNHQELTSARWNIENNSKLISTSPSSQEINNIPSNQELITTETDGQVIENFTKHPEINSTSQDSLSNLNLGNSEIQTLAHFNDYTTIAATTGLDEELRSPDSSRLQNIENPKRHSNFPQNTKEVLKETQPNSDSRSNKSETKKHSADFEEEEERSTNSNLSHNIQKEDANLSTITEESSQSHPDDSVTENQTLSLQLEFEENTTKDNLSDRMSNKEIFKHEIAPKESREETTQTSLKKETSNAFNKFEDTLKSIIENAKRKKEQTHATNLEHSQIETTTSATDSKAEHSNPLASADETTVLPKKFEEELQMAVKALEQTTHKHFEEFQNNLKNSFKKFTKFGMTERVNSEEGTTFKSEVTSQSSEIKNETTFIVLKDNGNQNTTLPKIKEETTAGNLNILMEDTSKTEEPRTGAIHQQFVDTFDEIPTTKEISNEHEHISEVERFNTELPLVKNEALTLANNVEAVITEEHFTERLRGLTTMLPSTEKVLDAQDQQPGTTYEQTTITTALNEGLATSGKESITRPKESTTEFINETTVSPALLVSGSLQENASQDSNNKLNETNSEDITTEVYSLTKEHQQQQSTLQKISETPSEQETVQENHTEVIHTDLPVATIETDMFTTTSPETRTPQEMVKVIEHTENETTEPIIQQKHQQNYYQHANNTRPTTQTQLPLTQASFMEEQQQQIESTTANLAQTQATDETLKLTTITATSTTTLENTTSAENNTTTAINDELQEEGGEITTVTPELESFSVEAEARSLSLPPPKLEYLQSEDGVEVFYGYSIVKRN